jgi:hypothetical protein
MKRPKQALTILAFWLTSAALLFSQNQLAPRPCPDEDAVGCELIAWSQLQEPVPLREASSPPDRPGDKEGAASSELQSETRGAQFPQTVVGVIVKNQGRYCLRVNGWLDLVLDDQRIAQRHESERVRIEGVVDKERKTLRVEVITPAL